MFTRCLQLDLCFPSSLRLQHALHTFHSSKTLIHLPLTNVCPSKHSDQAGKTSAWMCSIQTCRAHDNGCVPIPTLPSCSVCQKKILHVPIRSMWDAVCQKNQDTLRHPVRFCSMQASILFWPFWPTILCTAENMSHTSRCVTETKRRVQTLDSWLTSSQWLLTAVIFLTLISCEVVAEVQHLSVLYGFKSQLSKNRQVRFVPDSNISGSLEFRHKFGPVKTRRRVKEEQEGRCAPPAGLQLIKFKFISTKPQLVIAGTLQRQTKLILVIFCLFVCLSLLRQKQKKLSSRQDGLGLTSKDLCHTKHLWHDVCYFFTLHQ